MIARALLSGNAHQPLNVANLLTAQQQVTQLQQPTCYPPIAPPQPPALPPAPMPPMQRATVIQDATAIQTQATVLPPSPPAQTIALPAAPKLPKLTKRQQRAIAICAGLAAGIWAIDAIFPGSLGKAIQGVQALYHDAPTLPTTEAPTTEPTAEPTPAETPVQEDSAQEPSSTIEASPEITNRVREALGKPAAPTE